MKKTILACGDARAQSSGLFGAGVALGDPTGLTVKYWLDGSRAKASSADIWRRGPKSTPIGALLSAFGLSA